ncbi:MAG: L-threonylcarbamoyladenylate synthase [Candidatus Sericytochromatia bacterium]
MITPILDPTPAALAQAVQALTAGQLIGLPTETVYGLAGHAFDEQAVAAIFAAKERPRFDPLIVHLAQAESLEDLAAQQLIDIAALPAALKAPLNALIRACWPGPLTLVLPRHARVPELVTSGLETVALRVPAHPVAQALIRQSFPLAAPSANRFGRISPTTAAAVRQELDGRLALILEGGPCSVGLESSVVGCEGKELILLRPGQLDLATLSARAGLSVRPAQVHPAEVRAPGMLASHYAPQHSLRLFENRGQLAKMLADGLPRAVLLLRPLSEAETALGAEHVQHVLSSSGDLSEVAQGFFAGLRALDQEPVSEILAEVPPPGPGLAHALRDRLFKAAGQRVR